MKNKMYVSAGYLLEKRYKDIIIIIINMFVALSFVGTLPSYIVESIYQIRCFFNGDIYLIINDINSQYLLNIQKYNVTIIDYTTVCNLQFIEIVNKNMRKFCIVENLKGREQLFIRSFERFFLLRNLMVSRNLQDCLFLELDNLIYDDPHIWVEEFSKHELCYMYDNDDRCSSGLMYVKEANSLDNFLDYILHFISNSNEFMTEMTTLYRYFEMSQNHVQILPTFWNSTNVPTIACTNYNKYNNTIFDALAIGCYLLGLDPHHTQGVVTVGKKAEWCAIDYTKEVFEWKVDKKGRKIPYIYDGTKWLRINNLHVHSKQLQNGLSLPIEEKS